MEIKCIKLNDMKLSVIEDGEIYKYMLPDEIAEIKDKSVKAVRDRYHYTKHQS